MINEELNKLSKIILESAIEVHKELGPGLLESVYEICLTKTLNEKDIKVKKPVSIPIIFKGEKLDADFRIDLLIENEIIIELKSVETLSPVHEAQLITYLKLADKKLGFLINFNVSKLIDGFHRKVLSF